DGGGYGASEQVQSVGRELDALPRTLSRAESATGRRKSLDMGVSLGQEGMSRSVETISRTPLPSGKRDRDIARITTRKRITALYLAGIPRVILMPTVMTISVALGGMPFAERGGPITRVPALSGSVIY